LIVGYSTFPNIHIRVIFMVIFSKTVSVVLDRRILLVIFHNITRHLYLMAINKLFNWFKSVSRMDSGNFDLHHSFIFFGSDLFECINSESYLLKVISCFLSQNKMIIRDIESDETSLLNETIHWKIESFALQIYNS